MRDDFAIPEDLSDEGRKVAEAIKDLLGPEATGGGCRAFYAPEEWADRGESYGTTSVLVLCHDGGALAPYCNMDYGAWPLVEKLMGVLRPLGYYVEGCTCWYSAVYPIG